MALILIFLSSGLFLGWSLGANDAANIFGTAVGTKMLRFGTAAIVGSILGNLVQSMQLQVHLLLLFQQHLQYFG
jgi:phosphate/sulfate permease